MFFQQPIVEFSLNELDDERAKLEGQIADGVRYAHQTVGLASLIKRAADITGADLKRLGSAREDEVSKTTFATVPTFLAHFLLHFFIEQLWTEQSDVQDANFRNLSMDEIDRIRSLFEQFGDQLLLSLCLSSIKLARSKVIPFWLKRRWLRKAQTRARRLAEAKEQSDRRLHEDCPERKLFLSTGTSTYLSGKGLD